MQTNWTNINNLFYCCIAELRKTSFTYTIRTFIYTVLEPNILYLYNTLTYMYAVDPKLKLKKILTVTP